jgi:hypothetical protein
MSQPILKKDKTRQNVELKQVCRGLAGDFTLSNFHALSKLL